MQKSATSARAIEPASPSMTLMTPVGASTLRPPGRTMHHSRSAPGPPAVKSASWLFLSAKIELITVIMSILNTKGAWSLESPAPIDVTTAMRFTSYFFIAAMTAAVPSVSIVGPTSLVLPPSEMITPSMSPPSKTFSTSDAEVTVPLYLNSLSLTTSSSLPVEPSGVSRFAGVRQSARTAIPRSSSWCVHSRPVKPVDPKTATAIEGAARRAWPPRTERSAGARRPEASVARAAKNLIFGSSVATSARESGRRNLRVSGARNHKWPLDAASEQSGGVKQIQQAPRRREVQGGDDDAAPSRRLGSWRVRGVDFPQASVRL
mmetsp:Transcript_1829/g.5513  ORF Transcript_1829/g.5513 Transcript_1829/m.5513 type:complete len:319 (+) Transcript_1829:185-1141(+)